MNTREKLAVIEDIFPEERVERSKERWRRLWENEDPLDRFPFTFLPLTFNYYDAGETPEERLQATLDDIIARKDVVDDFVPSLFTGCKQSTMPSLFGAREIVVNGDFSAEKIIKCNDDFRNLPDPVIGNGTPAWEWLEMQKYFLDETDGALPIHVTDSQGPLDIAGSMAGYENVLLLAYTEEDVYFSFMDKLADAFITYWNKQKELIGDLFIGTHLGAHEYVPPSFGCALSADSLVMLSEDFYVNYYEPVVKMISDTFGGLCIHACGNWAHLIKRISDADYITGIHTGEMTTRESFEAGFNNETVVSDETWHADIEQHFAVTREHKLRTTSIFPARAPEGVSFKAYNNMVLAEAEQVVW